MGIGVNSCTVELAGGEPQKESVRTIRRLEEHALTYPEARDEIVELLELYLAGHKSANSANAARSAVETIAATTMLELLSSDAEV